MKTYQLDSTNIAQEVFGNEAILINIPLGKYYSIRGTTGIRVLELLQKPANTETVLATIQNEFQSDKISARVEIEYLLSQLENENIITETSLTDPVISEESPIKLPYEKVELEIFDDMQELILLDPIHDVESFRGWPQKK
ncbi:PqqD family protein [Emticicia sp. BO119]|uniref:PqqD family protein n=1 Tax=Emticicia sp. BO119 TaxID=2757768 RepID=UPI0015F0767D|nr:PqqD family protein [Emticicia sp. BO119]MBA4853043.1 PqqD family protein [Emticicia sp. BO119]